MERLIFTQQQPHDFILDTSVSCLNESYGNGLPDIHHYRCKTCKTYSIWNKCGYQVLTNKIKQCVEVKKSDGS